MLEISYLIIVPSLIATFMVTLNKAFYANLIYCFGNVLLAWHNYSIGDMAQTSYFTILEVLSIAGVIIYLKQNNWFKKIELKKQVIKRQSSKTP